MTPFCSADSGKTQGVLIDAVIYPTKIATFLFLREFSRETVGRGPQLREKRIVAQKNARNVKHCGRMEKVVMQIRTSSSDHS